MVTAYLPDSAFPGPGSGKLSFGAGASHYVIGFNLFGTAGDGT